MFESPREQHQRTVGIPPTARATRAHMPAFAQGLFDDRITGMTALGWFQGARGSLSVYDTSFYRFVSQDAKELRRGTIENRFVETGFGCRAIGRVLPSGLVELGLRTVYQVGRLKLFGKNRCRSVHGACAARA